jgi:LysR family glycine cleavage system transcriptional activator
MSRRFPPLNALRMFEVVARTGNLTTAAAELHVTQSAVSRQIGLLEVYLGVQLFRRERHGVHLTKAGEGYSEQVMPALEQIAVATEVITAKNRSDVLKVRAYTTFIAKWLIPRLPDFRKRHPSIAVRIITGLRDVDFDKDEVDLAIQFGDGQWSGITATRLFPDLIEPVCSPAFVERHGSGEELLSKGPLLVSHYRRGDWDYWLRAVGRTVDEHAERMSFSSSVLTWQAAVDGLGVAIGQTAMLRSELENGLLVHPFGQPVSGENRAYWLLAPSVQRDTPKVRVFREWAMEMATSDALI